MVSSPPHENRGEGGGGGGGGVAGPLGDLPFQMDNGGTPSYRGSHNQVFLAQLANAGHEFNKLSQRRL